MKKSKLFPCLLFCLCGWLITFPDFLRAQQPPACAAALDVYHELSRQPSRRKARMHQTLSEAKNLRNAEFFDFVPFSMNNIDQADSLVRFMAYDTPAGEEWMPEIIMFPVYREESMLISELFVSDPESKSALDEAFAWIRIQYDEEENPVRIEEYSRQGEEWVPETALETRWDRNGEMSALIIYLWDDANMSWAVLAGYRAEDKYENQLLTERIWQFYSWDQWEPEAMEEYEYDAQGRLVESREYFFDPEKNIWTPETLLLYSWEEGRAGWSSMLYHIYMPLIKPHWIPFLWYQDVQWYDYATEKISHALVQVNPDMVDEVITEPDWKQRPEDIAWTNYMRLQGDYSKSNSLERISLDYWQIYDEAQHESELPGEWVPFVVMETRYDHLLNPILHTTLYFVDDEWVMIDGYRLDAEYRTNGSLSLYDVFGTNDENYDWQRNFRVQYFYTEQATFIPEPQKAMKAKIYPNPATDYIWLSPEGGFPHKANDQVWEVFIYSSDGRQVLYQHSLVKMSESLQISISHLKPGAYVLVAGNRSQRISGRFIKR